MSSIADALVSLKRKRDECDKQLKEIQYEEDLLKAKSDLMEIQKKIEESKGEFSKQKDLITKLEEKFTEEAEVEFIHFHIRGVKYLRLGRCLSDGSILWCRGGDLWKNKNGVKGRYVGELQDDYSINYDAEEPNLA